MAKTIGRWHRALVDSIAASPWLRGRAGPQAAWTHYERQARSWQRSAQRHAAARARAAAGAARLHDRHRGRTAGSRPVRVLPRWQAAIARLLGAVTERERRER